VILREDRVAAASCLFPLTENLTVARSLGTRHRAALGLTEECDAVVLVVSEETGGISLAKRGKLQSVSAGKLEDLLREAIGPERASEERTEKGARGAFQEFLRHDLIWLGAAMVLASTLIAFAHQKLRTERDFGLTLVHTMVGEARTPLSGELLVRINVADVDLTNVLPQNPQLSVEASRDAVNALSISGLSGVLEIDNLPSGVIEIGADDVDWVDLPLSANVEWQTGAPLRLTFRTTRDLEIDLASVSIPIDDSALDKRYECHPLEAIFDPDRMQLFGPSEILDAIERGERELELAPVVLSASDRGLRRERVKLSDALETAGCTLLSEHSVQVPIAPSRIEIDTIEREVAMICLDPARVSELNDYSLPAGREVVRYRIWCAGLIYGEPGTTAFEEFRRGAVRFVEDNLKAYVDVSEVREDGTSRDVPIREMWTSRWQDSPQVFLIDEEQLSPYQSLEVELEQATDGRTDGRILLEPRTP